MPTNFYLKTSVEAFFIALELYFAVPLGIALYPREGKIQADQLEEEFRNIKNSRGEVIREFVFNKGL